MNRNELKQMWFNLPTSDVVTKTILIETNYGHVTITSDGPNGFSEMKTSQGDNALQYALDCHNEEQYKEYKLVIK